MDNSGERQLHQGFVGREAVLAELDRLLVDDSIDRWVVLTGERGMGKSSILANWLARREAAHDFVPHHFVQRQHCDRLEPSTVVRSLAAQIEERYPAQRDRYARPQARLIELLSRVSAHELAPCGARMVLLIDGLDERQPASDLREVLAFLPRALPRGIRLLCAGRHCHPERDGFEDRCGQLGRLDLDDPSLADDNEATVRAFWHREAPELGLDQRFVEHAVRRAGGNVLHATTLRRHMASVPHAQRCVEAIPRGLPSLLAALWQRVASDPAAVRALGILCAAREPLSLEQLGRVGGWSNLAEQRAIAHVMRELVVETRRDNRPTVYRLLHDAIRSYLVEQLGPIGIRGHHQELADKLAAWPAPRDLTARRYALRHAVNHRIAAGNCQAIHALASSVDFLEAKCSEFGIDDVELDVRRAAEACLAAGYFTLARDLDDRARAIARESIPLRHDAGARAAPVWNTLRHGRRAVSGSDDTLKVWDLDDSRASTLHAHAGALPGVAVPKSAAGSIAPRARKPGSKHIILFLAANPQNTSRLVLQEECAAIERELQLARHGDDFEFRSKWVVTVDEMARHLISFEPTIIHFSGHGRGRASGSQPATSRDALVPGDSGIHLHDEQQGEQLVSGRALALMVKSAAPSARVVVLNACYSDGHAETLCQVVDCVVGMTRAIDDHAARSFAVAFYRALGYRFSVGNAVEHAVATLAAKQLPDESVPRVRTRNWADADQIRL
jgi:AAA ATPase domain/CHAT domain